MLCRLKTCQDELFALEDRLLETVFLEDIELPSAVVAAAPSGYRILPININTPPASVVGRDRQLYPQVFLCYTRDPVGGNLCPWFISVTFGLVPGSPQDRH